MEDDILAIKSANDLGSNLLTREIVIKDKARECTFWTNDIETCLQVYRNPKLE